jgi:hypothetical protein
VDYVGTTTMCIAKRMLDMRLWELYILVIFMINKYLILFDTRVGWKSLGK